MRNTITLLIGLCLSACAVAQTGMDSYASPPEALDRIEAITSNFRKIVVLTSGSEKLDGRSRQKVDSLTWTLAQENQGRLGDLLVTLLEKNGHPSLGNVELFLDELEHSGKYSNCDRLAFEKVLQDLAGYKKELPLEMQTRLHDLLANLRKIEPFDPTSNFKNAPQSRTDSLLTLEWQEYVTTLKRQYSREQLLKESASILPAK